MFYINYINLYLCLSSLKTSEMIKDRKGKNNPMYGRHFSPESKKKMSEKKLGKQLSEEHKAKMRKPKSEEHKAKMRKPKSEEHKRKLRENVSRGENHYRWKGDEVGYRTIHEWMRRHFKAPEFCQICLAKKPKELANITGIFSRNIFHWAFLCTTCHGKYDSARRKEVKLL